MQHTILVVDDDFGIRNLLSEFLQQRGYHTHMAKDGTQMWACLKQQSVDLIILDVMLPGDSGLELCKALRQTSKIPIIMLTAVSEDVDRILGLELGADDYLSKPFNPHELLARVRAILRRSQQEDVTDTQEGLENTIYEFAGWQLHQENHTLHDPSGLEVSLSHGEFTLLLCLVKHPRRPLSRDHLLDLTKSREAAPFDRSIDIQISRLRQKIEDNPKSPNLIKTVRSQGYMLATTVEQRETIES